MTMTDWLTRTLFRPAIARAVETELRARLAEPPPVRDDPADRAWHDLTAPAYLARPWHAHRDLLERVRRVCERQPLAARLVALTTDYVVGTGPQVWGDDWALAFWEHPQNRLGQRVYRWCDELTRAGELFLTLHRNPADGMSYVREVPAYLIDAIDTDPQDRECERRYHQMDDTPEGRWWEGVGAEGCPAERCPAERCRGLQQVPGTSRADALMLHYTINRPVGDVRGTPDLAPIVTWLDRYDQWLEDRVRINRLKGAYLWHVRIEGAMPGQLEAKRAQYSRVPRPGSLIVSDGSEEWTAITPEIGADDVQADGKALRLMIAAGAGVPLHFLAEGESATRATAREMNAATLRHFAHRQLVLAGVCEDVVRQAARRAGRDELEVTVEFESVLTESAS